MLSQLIRQNRLDKFWNSRYVFWLQADLNRDWNRNCTTNYDMKCAYVWAGRLWNATWLFSYRILLSSASAIFGLYFIFLCGRATSTDRNRHAHSGLWGKLFSLLVEAFTRIIEIFRCLSADRESADENLIHGLSFAVLFRCAAFSTDCQIVSCTRYDYALVPSRPKRTESVRNNEVTADVWRPNRTCILGQFERVQRHFVTSDNPASVGYERILYENQYGSWWKRGNSTQLSEHQRTQVKHLRVRIYITWPNIKLWHTLMIYFQFRSGRPWNHIWHLGLPWFPIHHNRS